MLPFVRGRSIGDRRLCRQLPPPVRQNVGLDTERQRGRFVDNLPDCAFLGLAHREQRLIEAIMTLRPEVFVAPLADEKTNDIGLAALRFLRSTGRPVIRGIRRDKSWMHDAGSSFATTADLITQVFSDELPRLLPIALQADDILAGIDPVATLFTGPPVVDLVKLGPDSPPVLRLRRRLIVNIDHDAGRALVEDTLRMNAGPMAMIASAARHTYQQLTQVAAALKEGTTDSEILGPIRRRYIRSLLS